MRIAITREVSRSIINCELSFMEREPIHLERARAQHAQYETALRGLGVTLLALPELPDCPDAVFVEDTALVLDEIAISTKPGAASRRPETATVAKALTPYRKLHHINDGGTVDGGDILRMGKQIFIGHSARTNMDAIQQIERLTAPYGYTVKAVKTNGCLHLKTAATAVSADTIVLNPKWVDPSNFKGFKTIAVDPEEPFAANGVLVGSDVIYPREFQRTQQRLLNAGCRLTLVEAAELAKAEGGVTCCSILFEA